MGGVARVALPDYHAPPAVRRVFWNATVGAEHRILGGHYWDGSALEGRPPAEDEPLPFMRNPIDYGLGFVKRTPDHPTMNQGVTSVVVDLVSWPDDTRGISDTYFSLLFRPADIS